MRRRPGAMALALALLAAGGCAQAKEGSARTLVRVNQVGYAARGFKEAVMMAAKPTGVRWFTVVDGRGRPAFRGRLPPTVGAWSRRWPAVYRLDFSPLTRPGTYAIRVGRTRSGRFRVVSPGSYRRLAAHAVDFFAAQRDGPDVIPGSLARRPSHLRDAAATVDAIPSYRGNRLVGRLRPVGPTVDVVGGWFDAGDYLKFVETASFDDVALWFALRDYGSGVADPAALRTEARFGTDWLLKMWDARRGVLYYQVGLGDGDDRSIVGDHDLWRLPQDDDAMGGRAYFLSHRPVFPANAPGAPISPSLAGRTAAALALCAQVEAPVDAVYARRCLQAGQGLYDRSDTRPGRLLTATPHGYYDEREWRDDLELAATELYRATAQLGGAGMPHPDPAYYLAPAARWADAYLASPLNGTDSLNLYDVSALAHHDLAATLNSPAVDKLERGNNPSLELPTSTAELIADLRGQLRLAARRAEADPFRLASVSGNVDTVPHALGNAIAARLLGALGGGRGYQRMAQQQLDWVLGANAWGESFVVGAGGRFPRCLAHQVANLTGSLSGHGRLLLGATVDGPTSAANLHARGAPDGYRLCSASGLGQYDGHAMHYRDDVTVAATSEPTDDYVALALLAFAQEGAR